MYPDAPNVEVVSVPGPTLGTRYGAEREAGTVGADLLIADLVLLQGFDEKGWLVHMTPEMVPALSLYSDDYIYPQGTVGALVHQVILWNTELLDSEPTLESLIDPAYKGKIGIGDPRAQIPNVLALHMLMQVVGEDGLRRSPPTNPSTSRVRHPGPRPFRRAR